MDIPRTIPLSNNSRIVFEVDTTQEQRMKVIESYLKEKQDKIDRAHRNPMFQEAKDFIRAHKKEILHDPANAHLRREVSRD